MPQNNEDDGYGWHALLTAAFGRDLAPKPFRVFDRRGRSTQLLAYAQADAAVLRARAADFADPKVMVALVIDTLDKQTDACLRRREAAPIFGAAAADRADDRDSDRAKKPRARRLFRCEARRCARTHYGSRRPYISIGFAIDLMALVPIAEGLRLHGLESLDVVRRGSDLGMVRERSSAFLAMRSRLPVRSALLMQTDSVHCLLGGSDAIAPSAMECCCFLRRRRECLSDV